MKTVFYPKLAFDAIRKNRRMYFPYILTGSVMVMMYYILMSMLESPDLQDMHGGSFLMDLLPFGCAVIAIFSLLFLFYTSAFLVKQRYREFGLYNILGMDKRNIGRLMLWETIYTAGISIFLGLASGIAFSKAAELILLNILASEITFSFHVGFISVVVTALIYVGIYALIFVNTLIKVSKTRPLELMQSSRVGEKRLKSNPILALLGAVLVGYAYYMALSIKNPTEAFFYFFVAVVMVIVGTYLLFIAGSVALCKLLQMNKRYYYKPNHFVSVSSMAYRMKRNGAGLASICILLTMVLVMLSSTTTLYFGEEDSIRNRYPNGINITYYFETIDGIGDESLDVQRNVISKYAPSDTDLTGTRYAISAGQFTDDGIIFDYTHVDSVDYDRVGYLYIISTADYNAMTGDNKNIADDECMIYSHRLGIEFETFTTEYGNTYKVCKMLDGFTEDSSAVASTMPSAYIVVNDIHEFLSSIADRKNDYGYSMVEYKWILGFDCDNKEDETDIKNELQEAIANSADDENPWRSLYLESREEEKNSFYEMYGSFFFLGIMLGVVFLMAAVLIIYYRQISEGYEDRNRFEIMQKVGMTKRDIRSGINSQILTVFFLPLLLAGVHLAFAFPFIYKILTIFMFDNLTLSIVVNLACFGIFGLFYAVVYKITSHTYYSIVSGDRE